MMRQVAIASVASVLFASLAQAQTKDAAPRGEAPKFWRAVAESANRKVLVQIARPAEQASPDGGFRSDGVFIQPSGTVMNWVNDPRKMTLGENAFAYRTDGKIMEPAEVVKALKKAAGVAVLVRSNAGKAIPEPFFLSLLRDDVVVLVAERKEIYPVEP